MATQADITVKKADGTTNVVYVAATPSAGDKSPAVWTQNAYSGVLGNRPRLELTTQNNSSGDTRQVRYKLIYPVTYVDSTTGLEKQLAYLEFNGQLYMPKSLTTTAWKEAAAQLGNLLASAALVAAAETGYAPT